MINQKKLLVSILEKAKTGLLTLIEYEKEWSLIDESELTKVLHEDIESALLHLPTKSLSSKEIDFTYWRNQHEYRTVWLDLVLIEIFDNESDVLEARKKIFPSLQEMTDEEVIASLSNSTSKN